MKHRVLVIGTVGIDVCCPIERFPRAGHTLFGEGCEMLPGGKALIAAMTLAEMGMDPVICSVLGEDGAGEQIREFCCDMGLDSRFLFSTRDASTAKRILLSSPEGKCHTICYQGSVELLSEEQIEEAFTCLPDAVYLQGDLPMSIAHRACLHARAHGIPIFMDPGPRCREYDYEALGRFEIFTPSEDEMEQLILLPMSNQEEIMRVCLHLAAKVDARFYLLKLGSRGAMLYDGTYYRFSTAYDVEEVDTSGVGDVHSAILVAEYLKSGDIRRAMEYANAGAALSVTKRGSIASIPHYEQIARVVAENAEAYQ